jgi:TRAP transporter TAXI family solute receptor
MRRVVIAFGLVGALSASAGAHALFYHLTGGQGGVYYPLGVASQIYTKAIPSAKATAQVTKGSAENLNLLQAGRSELAFTLGDVLSDAWRATRRQASRHAQEAARPLRHLQQLQIIARADSGIGPWPTSARVSFSAARSGTELSARDPQGTGLSYWTWPSSTCRSASRRSS